MRRAGLIAGLLGALALGPPAHAETTVDYQGLRITVPGDWPVRRLGRDSTECVRFDRHALYLGPAGHGQDCPAHPVGRTETLHVEPLEPQAAALASSLIAGGVTASPGRATRTYVGRWPALAVNDPGAGELRLAVPGAGVLVTGSYGSSRRELDRVLAGITPVPDAPSAERRSGEDRVSGRGFDTCTAPSLAAMRAWRKDFVAANIYIGGPARSCPDGRLSRDWVSAVRAMGWRLIPTYVGPQAPCTDAGPRFSRDNAALAGQLSAADAVDRATALGLPPKSPIYLDVEAYDRHSAACRQAVLTFVDSWVRGLRVLRYTSGVYSSVGSGIRDLGEADGISRPTAIWFAHWDRKPGVREDPYLRDDWWPGHRRIKQYRGDHREKHGGYRLNIDSDTVDGYVR